MVPRELKLSSTPNPKGLLIDQVLALDRQTVCNQLIAAIVTAGKIM